MSTHKSRASHKISVYIDGPNLFHCGEPLKWRIDYTKFKPFIVKDRTLVDLNFYNSKPQNRGDASFHNYLRSKGYNVKEFKLKRYSGKPKEKKLEPQMVADSLWDAFHGKYDIAIFCSGDVDVLPAIEYIQIMGKPVEIYAYYDGLSWDLRTCGAKVTDLTKLKNLLER